MIRHSVPIRAIREGAEHELDLNLFGEHSDPRPPTLTASRVRGPKPFDCASFRFVRGDDFRHREQWIRPARCKAG